MGLDASVSCSCYTLGLTPPPPVPVALDEEGYLEPREDLPEHEAWRGFSDWRMTACAHRDMEYASERISNWSGYRLLQDALGKVGWQHFPVLHRELPNANDGCTSAQAAAVALDELADFRRRAQSVVVVQLRDAESGEVLRTAVPQYEGQFVWSQRAEWRLTAEGTLEVFRGSELLFQSASFELLMPAYTYAKGETPAEAVLRDRRTGVRYSLGAGHPPLGDDSPDGTVRYPRVFEVTLGEVRAEYYDYALEPLERIFAASVETGNPVRWC